MLNFRDRSLRIISTVLERLTKKRYSRTCAVKESKIHNDGYISEGCTQIITSLHNDSPYCIINNLKGNSNDFQ